VAGSARRAPGVGLAWRMASETGAGFVVRGDLTCTMFARQDQAQGDAHKEGFMELSKIATRHISRSIFSDQVTGVNLQADCNSALAGKGFDDVAASCSSM
jgi:hypothetical protein